MQLTDNQRVTQVSDNQQVTTMSNLHKIDQSNIISLITNMDEKNLNGGAFTIRSKRTGKDYTFKISHKPFNGFNYLHIKVETEYMNFRYMGYYREGQIMRRDKQTKQLKVVDTPASTAISWFIRMIKAGNFDILRNGVDIFHIGKCLKCGKPLTDSTSIEYGIGPICRNK